MKNFIALIYLAILSSIGQAQVIDGPYESYKPTQFGIVDSFTYNYGPTTVYIDGTYHQFYCSEGLDQWYSHPDKVGGWDYIRYRTSRDGYHWSAPRVVLSQSRNSTGEQENCACDPSIIKKDGFWYLYYGGNIDNWNGAIYVARSNTIGGPYEHFTKRNTWELMPNDPKPILTRNTMTNHLATDGTIYGLGQISVVNRNGVIHGWFTDRDAGVTTRFIHVSSSRPENFDTSFRESISIDGNFTPIRNDFGDVKWNPLTSEYDLWMTDEMFKDNASIIRYTSSDGRNFKKTSDAFGKYNQINNIGVSGNELGEFIDGKYIISFGGPVGTLNGTSKWAYWSMWEIGIGTKKNEFSNISRGWKWQGMDSTYRIVAGDFDGDGITDRAIVSKDGEWYIISSRTGENGVSGTPWGWKWQGMDSTYRIIAGDFDGDGITDRAIVSKDGEWYIISSRTGENGITGIPWGKTFPELQQSSEILAGDFDGDHKTDIAYCVRSESKYYVYKSSEAIQQNTTNISRKMASLANNKLRILSSKKFNAIGQQKPNSTHWIIHK